MKLLLVVVFFSLHIQGFDVNSLLQPLVDPDIKLGSHLHRFEQLYRQHWEREAEFNLTLQSHGFDIHRMGVNERMKLHQFLSPIPKRSFHYYFDTNHFDLKRDRC
jgi:hypothetical protein